MSNRELFVSTFIISPPGLRLCIFLLQIQGFVHGCHKILNYVMEISIVEDIEAKQC
jgi:hypothetical protein